MSSHTALHLSPSSIIQLHCPWPVPCCAYQCVQRAARGRMPSFNCECPAHQLRFCKDDIFSPCDPFLLVHVNGLSTMPHQSMTHCHMGQRFCWKGCAASVHHIRNMRKGHIMKKASACCVHKITVSLSLRRLREVCPRWNMGDRLALLRSSVECVHMHIKQVLQSWCISELHLVLVLPKGTPPLPICCACVTQMSM